MIERKTDRLHVLVTPAQKAAFNEAAARDGISLSAWIVQTLTRAARNEQRTGRV
jgi:predicted HicB family RNase H-like nuclease